jgi:hypothetical protein
MSGRIDWLRAAVWSGLLVWSAVVYFLAGVGLAHLAGWTA